MRWRDYQINYEILNMTFWYLKDDAFKNQNEKSLLSRNLHFFFFVIKISSASSLV